jgi:hypothetical protein
MQRFEQPSMLKFTYIPYLVIIVNALSPQLSSLELFIRNAHNIFTGSVVVCVTMETKQRKKAVYARPLKALTLQISIPAQNMSASNDASAIIIITNN